MDFKLNKEQEAIQKAAKDFAKGNLTRMWPWSTRGRTNSPPRYGRRPAAGLIGIHYPEKYGGQDYGILENALVVEEFCRADSGLGIAVTLSDFASEIILRFGSEEQKQKYLIPITRGEVLSSGGFTEPDHGSDITLMNTTAVRDGNEYVLNGVKTFITNGTISNFVLVLCQTDDQVKPSYGVNP